MSGQSIPKPEWLKKRLPAGFEKSTVSALIKDQSLHTVCQEAKCPNCWECFSRHTATFLILGRRCTRSCRFCNIAQGPKKMPDPFEPARVAETALKMNLTYVVVTSVARDDLDDGGAWFFAETIRELRKKIKNVQIEVLIPDFRGSSKALKTVVKAGPDVLNHNMETVSRLYPEIRPDADYRRSLNLLKYVRSINSSILTKSGLMLGLGETDEEVREVMIDLADSGCCILTLGQYLQPSKTHAPVKRYIHPQQFDDWRKKGIEIGFDEIVAGPFVRSSYHAQEIYHTVTADI